MMSPGDQDAGSRSVWLCGRASHGHDREAPAGLLKAEGLECFRGMRWTANVVRFGVRRSFHLVHSRASDSCQWLCLSSVLRWILIAITTQIRLPSLAPHKSNAPHKSVTRRTDRLTILLGEQDPEYVCVYLEFGAQGLWLFFSLRTYRVPSSCHKKRTKYEAEIFCAILLYPLGCPDWQGSWNVLLAHLELHLSNELVSQVLRSSRLAKL